MIQRARLLLSASALVLLGCSHADAPPLSVWSDTLAAKYADLTPGHPTFRDAYDRALAQGDLAAARAHRNRILGELTLVAEQFHRTLDATLTAARASDNLILDTAQLVTSALAPSPGVSKPNPSSPPRPAASRASSPPSTPASSPSSPPPLCSP